MYGDIVESAEAVLDTLRCIEQCHPPPRRLSAWKNVRDEFRSIAKFFHRDPQLVAPGGIESIESLGFLGDLLAPPSQPFGGMALDRPFMTCARGLAVGMAPRSSLHPGGKLDQKLAIAVRSDCVDCAPEGLGPPSLEIPVQAAEVGAGLVLFAEGYEHFGNIHVEIACERQLFGNPLELGFDELGLESGCDVRTERYGRPQTPHSDADLV